MEKRIEELEESVKTLAKYMKNELKKVQVLSKQDHRVPIDDKVNLLSKELRELRKLVSQNVRYDLTSEDLDEAKDEVFAKKLTELRPLEKRIEKELDQEDTDKMALMKNISDVRYKVQDIESNIEKFDNIHQKQQSTQRNIEELVNRHLVKELSKFAADIDKKYPELATRFDLEKFQTQIRKKIEMIEVPDMSHIESKVVDLERKISRLVLMIEDIYNKLPAVVE
ncbi:hypothetical protein ACFLQN_02360 [Candidatus Aenigmatarchaeota archaeon]